MIDVPIEEQNRVKILRSKLKSLQARRMPWEQNWQNIVNYVAPDRGDFSSITRKGRITTRLVYDGTAPWANEQFASGLISFLTSPTERWFSLETLDPNDMKSRRMRQHLEDTTNVLYDGVFNAPRSDFNSQNHELFMDLGAFGTSPMLIEDPPGDVLKYRTFSLNNCWIAENDRGRVDTLYRRFNMTGRHLINNYKEKLSPQFIKNIEKDPYKEFEIFHFTEPNDRFLQESPLAINKPWSSIFVLFEQEENRILEESGFDEFPYVVPRWKRSPEEWYGRSPAMNALPDIMMINEVMKTTIKAAQLQVAPPLQVPDEGFLGPLRFSQWGVNFYRAGSQDRIEKLPVEARADIGLDFIQNRIEQILRTFFVDLTRMTPSKVEKTRAEVLIQQEDKMRNISPMTGRLQLEYLTPLIQRTYNIQLRRGNIESPPTGLDVPIRIKYISPVQRAQKSSQINNVTRWMETFIPLLDIKPETGDRFNTDEYVKWSHDLLDAPEKILFSDEEVQQIRESRNKQQQLAQINDQANLASQTGVNAAKAQNLLNQ